MAASSRQRVAARRQVPARVCPPTSRAGCLGSSSRNEQLAWSGGTPGPVPHPAQPAGRRAGGRSSRQGVAQGQVRNAWQLVGWLVDCCLAAGLLLRHHIMAALPHQFHSPAQPPQHSPPPPTFLPRRYQLTRRAAMLRSRSPPSMYSVTSIVLSGLRLAPYRERGQPGITNHA